MQRIRVGFVGLGGICRTRHVPGLRRIEGIEIVAVANRTIESSRQVAAELGIPETCESWQELIARDDLDAVFIGTWPYMHKPISIAALNAGKHVFCQARMAMDFQEAREMQACARQCGRVAMLCPVPFGLSVDATVARWIRDGRLGQLRFVRVESFSNTYLAPDAPMNWRKDHRLSGLNTLTLGMFIEVIHRWFGWTRMVSAMTQTFVLERKDANGVKTAVRVPDQILINAIQENGCPVQYAFSGCVPYSRDTIEIHGTETVLQYDIASDVLYEVAGDGSPGRVPILPEDAYDVSQWRVEEDFVNAIRKGSEYHPSFYDGMRYMQVIQAVHDSAAFGATIRLGDV